MEIGKYCIQGLDSLFLIMITKIEEMFFWKLKTIIQFSEEVICMIDKLVKL